MARSKVVGKTLEAWSYSRYSTYTTCPGKIKFGVFQGIKEPAGPAMKRGREVHDKAEGFVTKKIRSLPAELKNYREDFRDLRNHPSVAAEDSWCFDEGWNEVDWFSKQAWLRIKVDAHHRVVPSREHPEALEAYERIMESDSDVLESGCVHRIVDYKTGKPRPESDQLQVSLYALGCFKKYDEVDAAIVELWYLDGGEPHEAVFFRADLDELEKAWVDRTRRMLNDTRFEPTPGWACRYCFFNVEKGGPCRAPKAKR